MYRKIRCPVLMIHGDNDQIQPYARAQAVAELTGAELVTIRAAGTTRSAAFRPSAIPDHRFPRSQARDCRARETGERSAGKAKRALYLSSPIGLGHGRRDIAITRELRKLHPDLRSTGWHRIR